MAWNGSYSRQWRHIAISMDRRICPSAACKLYGVSQDFDVKAQRALDDSDSGLDGDLEADRTGSRTKSAPRAHAWQASHNLSTHNLNYGNDVDLCHGLTDASVIVAGAKCDFCEGGAHEGPANCPCFIHPANPSHVPSAAGSAKPRSALTATANAVEMASEDQRQLMPAYSKNFVAAAGIVIPFWEVSQAKTTIRSGL